MAPQIPSEGPCRGTDDCACQIRFNFWRPRTTGPCFPLAVCRCLTHGCSFTVYPPGFVPYARFCLAQISTFGHEGSLLDPSSPTMDSLFRGTSFQAALDASVGVAWQRDSSGGTERWWPDQRRTLARHLRQLGVAPDLPDGLRERLADALDVDQLFLNDCIQKIRLLPGYRRRGQAITAVLGRVVSRPCVLERLLVSGYLAGLWGFPLRWDADPGVLRSLPFRQRGSRSPPP